MLDRVDELVIKPVEGSGGYGIVFGPDASEKELATISKKIRSDPRGWIAQPVVQLSTVPDADRRQPGAPARRPAAVRRQRRRQRLGAARRADPGRAARRDRWWSTPARAADPRTPGCWRRGRRWPTASWPRPKWCAIAAEGAQGAEERERIRTSPQQQQQQQSQPLGRASRVRNSNNNSSSRR